MGDVRPADVEAERDAWAEHFRLIGEGEGLVADRVWDSIPYYSPMNAVWGHAPAPNELHAAVRQMSLGKAAGEDEVTAELLKFRVVLNSLGVGSQGMQGTMALAD